MEIVVPISFFGSCGYFQVLANAKTVLIETKSHFNKGSISSRCEILSPNGIQQLPIPVVRKNGSKTLFDEISIAHDIDWRKKMWKSIETAYSSAPFFDYYGMDIEALIYQNETNLLEYTLNCTYKIMEWLSLESEIKFTTTYYQGNDKLDLRFSNFDYSGDFKPYIQVFNPSNEFIPNLSILDLLFNEGPMARNWLIKK
ncbi:MAG: hypothetical protein RIT10_1368 [Bacteroidota bacterium]|jgi:hypothetical protein